VNQNLRVEQAAAGIFRKGRCQRSREILACMKMRLKQADAKPLAANLSNIRLSRESFAFVLIG